MCCQLLFLPPPPSLPCWLIRASSSKIDFVVLYNFINSCDTLYRCAPNALLYYLFSTCKKACLLAEMTTTEFKLKPLRMSFFSFLTFFAFSQYFFNVPSIISNIM
ncbi:hypothetical protein EGR_09723 [Echinococcus granulosus]|uniref:Uncharacterized protein n=1 Tax=Echinococcus granulosus TaxID=6210 RepID=W6UAB6_ECHGR|nr:hypothetical protein EGR_09723 [Echinococcus granulosus]EUB55412.1 hypothetical protein EGR_09723 [Echinococcus granulosus]